MNRKRFLYAVFAAPFYVACGMAQPPQRMIVHKDPTCGCCGKRVEHGRANGFAVEVQEVSDIAEYSRRSGVPPKLRGCHTAVVEGYTIEGNVPAIDIQRLLSERPEAKGLVVPGMPVGSPGMEGGQRQAYSVLLFDADGKTSVFQDHPA
jgi:hypothetical protein